MNPPAGPSSATSSNGTFCPTAIITCWSFAFGPSATSVTFDPGALAARFAASYSAWAAQGIQHVRQHELVLEPRPLRRLGGLEGLERVRDDAPEDDDLVSLLMVVRSAV